jgi:hypothetical protein
MGSQIAGTARESVLTLLEQVPDGLRDEAQTLRVARAARLSR